MKKIKWGSLGYATMTKDRFIPAVMRTSNSEFYALASRSDAKLKECEDTYNCSKLYRSYDELLEDDEVDAVYIPLPNNMHKEWTIKAARKGKHVLCEKPLALDAYETEEMIRECEKNNVKLMEAFMYRYSDRIKKVKELLQSGAIGEIKHISTTFGFFRKRENDYRMQRELGGGALYDVGSYLANFTGLITEDLPVSISAEHIMENGVDTAFSAVMRYENGIICSANCWFNAFFRAYSEIIGLKGVMKIPDTFYGNAGTITIVTSDGTREVAVEESDRYALEVENFADDILYDRRPVLGPEETLRNMKLLDMLQAANYETLKI